MTNVNKQRAQTTNIRRVLVWILLPDGQPPAVWRHGVRLTQRQRRLQQYCRQGLQQGWAAVRWCRPLVTIDQTPGERTDPSRPGPLKHSSGKQVRCETERLYRPGSAVVRAPPPPHPTPPLDTLPRHLKSGARLENSPEIDNRSR